MWQHPHVRDTTRKLLIVEDDPGIQSQLRWCFEDYDVLAATDRQSAINELRRHEPPVVLQDLGLPPDDEGVGEGFATLREILQLRERLQAEGFPVPLGLLRTQLATRRPAPARAGPLRPGSVRVGRSLAGVSEGAPGRSPRCRPTAP